MSKIREIIEKYVKLYYKQDWDTGREDVKKHIIEEDFGKLEKELQEYIRDYIEEVVWEIEMGEDA